MPALRLTPTVKWLLILCGAGFLVQQTMDQFFGGTIVYWLGLVPSSFINQGYVWQIVTYAFLHGDVFHLFLNMMLLVFIGSEIEALWGRKKFLVFYFTCTASAGVLYLLLQALIWKGESPMVGASGGIYGLLMAYGILFRERQLLFMMLFPMKAKHFVWVLAGMEFLTTVFSGRAGLSSAAHLGGMVAGLVYLWGGAWLTSREATLEALKRLGIGTSTNGRRKGKKSASHLKLIVDNPKKLKGIQEDEDDPGPKTWH